MRVPFVDLAAQHAELGEDIRAAFARVLERGDFILGEEVGAFEADFAAYCGTRFAIGTDSGLSALGLALRAVGVSSGDEVVTAANTFVATALAISEAGATPVLVDADPESYALDAAALEAAITPRTKAVVPVHLYGRPAAMDAIMAIAQSHGLEVVEDACQAHGARYRGRRVGGFGRAAAFSFYPSKNLGACGDAGMIVTDDPQIEERVRLLRNYGEAAKYDHRIKGFNRRLDTVQAAILRAKLPRLDEWNTRRRRHAELYRELLADTGVVLPSSDAASEHVWHLFVIRCDARDELRDALAGAGIATGIHYPAPIHLQPAYADLRLPRGSYPVAERLAGEVLSLPMYPELTEELVHRAADAVTAFFAARAMPRRPESLAR